MFALRAKEAPVYSILMPSPEQFQPIQSDLCGKHFLLPSSPAAPVTNMIIPPEMLS